jgi:hypothetical protein
MAMTGQEIDPAKHGKKEIREVLRALVAEGWTLRKEGHWGRLYCRCGCLTISVPGTPGGKPERTARRIARQARRCPLPEGDARRRPEAR